MNDVSIQLDRSSPLPIANQISDQLLRSILDGSLDPGERLPPERDLAERLGVSRGTVKRAYARLVETGAIDIRQGSGSYVLRNGHVLEQNQKREAAQVIAAALSRLGAMGLSEREVLSLVNLHLLSASGRKSPRKIAIMVVSNNHDILSELEQQLSYLTESSPFVFTLSFLTLDTVASGPDPVQVLLSYDLIIANMIDYPEILAIAPMFRQKIIEAEISPRTRTLIQLSSLPMSSVIGVIYRTDIFCSMVLRYLISLDFKPENIHCFHERDYNPEHHGQNGINVLINFNESPVFRDPAFRERNEEFTAAGGHILRFEYQIARESLVYIEDRLQQLLEREDAPEQAPDDAPYQEEKDTPGA